MYSTIGGAGSSQQVNFTIPVTTSQTVSALYTAQNIVDVAGLLVAIQNTSGSAVVLTAAGGTIVNTASFSGSSTGTTVTIAPNSTVVLETNLANLNYYIVSVSGISNIYGGSAGQLLYQSAPNTTNFVSAGATGQYLQANGTGTPTWVNPIANGITGGAAGNILYQSAANTTGFVSNGTTGQVLVSNGSSAPSWATVSGSIGTTVNNTGSAITITSPREFTLYVSPVTSGSTMKQLIAAYSIPDIDGNMYSVVNNTASAFVLDLQGIANGSSYSANNTFLNGTSINLFPGETVNIQTYITGNPTYTIVSTTQTQEVGFFATLSAMGQPAAGTDTLINYDSVNDPLSWFDNGNHRWVPQKAGYYAIFASFAFQTTSTVSNNNLQIRKNGSTQTINAWGTNGATATVQVNGYGTTIVFLNGSTDYVDVTCYTSSGALSPQTGAWSTFSGMLVK